MADALDPMAHPHVSPTVEPTPKHVDALDGMISASVAALRVQADDGAKAFATGVANDALEFAATEVIARLPALPAETQRAVMDMLRSLKRSV